MHARPNGLALHRFGMSVSRKVGIAAKRNVIRRRLRETFRLWQRDLPAGYDIVVVVRPHPPLMLADYQKLLSAAMIKLHVVWGKRQTSSDRGLGNPTDGNSPGSETTITP